MSEQRVRRLDFIERNGEGMLVEREDGPLVDYSSYLAARAEIESIRSRLRGLTVDAGDAPLTNDPVADIEAVLAAKDRELCGLAMLHAHQAEADALNYEKHDTARETAERELAVLKCRLAAGPCTCGVHITPVAAKEPKP